MKEIKVNVNENISKSINNSSNIKPISIKCPHCNRGHIIKAVLIIINKDTIVKNVKKILL